MKQTNLFGPPTPEPSGFAYAEDFITPGEEADLVAHIQALPLAPFQYGEYEAKRRVYNFGSHFDFSQGATAHDEPMPAWLLPLRGAAAAFAGHPGEDLVQAHLIEYSPGTPIGWHRDAPPYQEIIGISLLSACRFQLRRERPDAPGTWDRFEIEALPRSIYRMKGEARSVWQHAIPPVKELRYSVTFRTVPDGARTRS